MNVYEIKIPIYASSEQEAESARLALRQFVANHRERGIPVTAVKVAQALSLLQSSRFMAFQVERFLRP
jgi:hypothetical protein